MTAGARAAVCIVTYNSEDDLPGALAAVAALGERPLELVIADCGSSDRSVELARAFAAPAAGISCRVLPLGENRGFSGGMNAAIAACKAPWVLALNPDARPQPDFLSALLARAATPAGQKAGSLTGRLLRPPAGNEPDRGWRLDACGMMLRRSWRHLDRGSDQPDHGQYPDAELVFGGTGAATLYRRAALLDVAFAGGEIFDPLFHSYREDAELAFRLQERGWTCIYEPAARAEHRRSVVPAGRARVSPFINYHSLKNRYLLRAYHQSAGNFLRTLVPTLLRDLGALGWVLLRERSSLPAYGWLWRQRREILARRRYLFARRKAGAEIFFARESLPLP
jgi:GT2 family glycosyltransferase